VPFSFISLISSLDEVHVIKSDINLGISCKLDKTTETVRAISYLSNIIQLHAHRKVHLVDKTTQSFNYKQLHLHRHHLKKAFGIIHLEGIYITFNNMHFIKAGN
jgi:hypothetical protein